MFYDITVKDSVLNSNMLRRFIAIDKQYPIITLNSQNSIITNGVSFNLNFSVSDDSFSFDPAVNPLVYCSLYINDTFNNNITVSSSSPVLISPVLTGLEDGLHTYYFICNDKAGYTTQSETRNFTLDTTGPNIILNSPLNNSVIKASDILDFNIYDDYSDVSSAWYSLDNGLTNTTLNSPYDIDTTGWSEGIKQIIIYTNDTLNNFAQEQFTFKVDATPPSVVLINPPNETLTNQDQDYYYNATDTYSTNLNCTLLINGTEKSSKISLSGSIDYLTTTLPTGTYEWQIDCTDEVGFSTVSEKRTIIIDKTLPAINLLAPKNETNLNNPSVSFNYTATDNIGIINCSLYINDILNTTIDYNGATSITESIPLNLDQGTYEWYITCIDNATNSQISEKRILYYDIIPPVISNIKEENLSYNSITITWETDEPATSIIYYNKFNDTIQNITIMNLVTYHVITLTSLDSSTIYYYNISSSDYFNNTATTIQYNFTTSEAPSSSSPSGGGGGGGTAGVEDETTCVTDWDCTAWSQCSQNGVQTRRCIDRNDCVSETFETRSCTYRECTSDEECITGYICEDSKCVLPQKEAEIPSITGFAFLDLFRENKTTIGAGIAMILIISSLVYYYRFRSRPKLVDQDLIKESIRIGRIR
jgi:hypothetical protein